jgi:hypothetical protein
MTDHSTAKLARNELMRHAFVKIVDAAIERSQPHFRQSSITDNAAEAIHAVALTGSKFAWGAMQLYGENGKLICNCPASEAAVAYSAGNFPYQFDTLVKEHLNVGDAERGIIEVW